MRLPAAALLFTLAACQDRPPDVVPSIARDPRPTLDDSLLFTEDTFPRLLTLADETDALSGDELHGPVDGPWWAVTDDPAAIQRVDVVSGRIPHPCLPDDTTITAHTVQLAPGSTTHADHVIAIIRGIPMKAGPVRAADADSIFAAPESPAGGADSALYTFDRHALRLWRTPAGEGFQLHAGWGDQNQVVYATEFSDEGSWEPLLIADLNRDDIPDLLIDATPKYSLRVLRLLLSEQAGSRVSYREVAAHSRSAC